MGKPEHTTAGGTPMVGMHYQLHCYVCGHGCTKPSPFDSWATFTQIFRNRPDGCRFAVARLVPVFETHPRGPYVAWDLHDDELVRGKRVGPSGLIAPPPALWRSDSVDGLVMKAMALYDRG